MWKNFAIALSFLTILPVPQDTSLQWTPDGLAKSFCSFPVVGLILGAIWLAPAYLLSGTIPHMLLAVLLTTAMILLTRALHLDGIADLADGIGGGYTPERRLAIMKDSRIGAFGTLALVLDVSLKSISLDTLILNHCWTPFLLAPTLSRLAMVLTAFRATYPRKEGGLGKPFLDHITSREIAITSLFSFLLTLLLSPILSPIYISLVLAIVLSSRSMCQRLLGGITGDVLGAVNEMTEIALLCFAACVA